MNEKTIAKDILKEAGFDEVVSDDSENTNATLKLARKAASAIQVSLRDSSKEMVAAMQDMLTINEIYLSDKINGLSPQSKVVLNSMSKSRLETIKANIADLRVLIMSIDHYIMGVENVLGFSGDNNDK